MVTIAKKRINKIIKEQPDDSSFDEIIRELVFAQMIDRGLQDSKDGKLTSHEDLKKEIESWSK